MVVLLLPAWPAAGHILFMLSQAPGTGRGTDPGLLHPAFLTQEFYEVITVVTQVLTLQG